MAAYLPGETVANLIHNMKNICNQLFLIILIGLPAIACCQQCSCEKKFAFIKRQIETNYAGFSDKVNPSTQKDYDKITREYSIKAKHIKNDALCIYTLQNWVNFFKDGHIHLNGIDANKKKEIIKLTSVQIKQLEQSSKKVEGIYYSFDSSFKIAVLKNKTDFRDYAGVIISSEYQEWKEGQVKLELKKIDDSSFTAITYEKNHFYYPELYRFDGISLGAGNWVKSGEKDNEAMNKAAKKAELKGLAAKKLSDSTLYIQIGSFSITKAKAIDSLFKANESLLRTTPNLILDVRYNGGGDDGSYKPIQPWLYTNPVISVGDDVYATEDNIRIYKQRLTDPGYSESDKAEMKALITTMEHNIGKFVLFSPDDTITFDKVEPYPKKVIILINKGCGSSTEQFLLDITPSAKVTLMGTHTYGGLDYSNVIEAESPCGNIQFGYASTRSHRIVIGKSIDNIGIKPDIEVAEDKDLVAEALKLLER